MNIIAGVAELQAITTPFVERIQRPHLFHGKRFSVERPLIESVEGGVVLDDRHLDGLIRFTGRGRCLAKARVVPAEWLWGDPFRLAFLAVVFQDPAHSMTAIVIGKIPHHPHAGMIHLDDRGDTLCGAEPEHGYVNLSGYGIPIERYEKTSPPCGGEVFRSPPVTTLVIDLGMGGGDPVPEGAGPEH